MISKKKKKKKVFAEIRWLFLAEIENLSGFSSQKQVISKIKKKGLRRNRKFKRFFRPKTGDLPKKKKKKKRKKRSSPKSDGSFWTKSKI